MAIGSCNVININSPSCNLQPTTNNWKHTVINERIVIPDSMPDIKSIKSVNLSMKITSSNFIITPDSVTIPNVEGTYLTGLKLVVNGEVNETITYDSGEACKLYSFNHKEPFTTFIVMDPNFNISNPVCLKSCIEGVLVQQISCRQIVKDVAIFVTAK